MGIEGKKDVKEDRVRKNKVGSVWEHDAFTGTLIKLKFGQIGQVLDVRLILARSLDESVEEWEAEIDDRVAHLYGLTAEDMKIIRGE
ncbi:hypothetical protein [Oscillatoria acuminata]|uniref:hypothetical protein n=1 Tax=Oscillatoria acuminata TaxID=118323 RepID=UPI0005C77553|nr:hypothetical protein [Oscillatoria acuminata]